MTESTREARLSAAFVKLADTLTDEFDVVDLFQSLVEECVEILDTQAAGLMLLDAGGELQLVASSSEEASLIEVMQLNAGAGPCVECFTTGKPVTVGDIEATGDRWLAFRQEAMRQGFKSVHATPMRLRGQILGALNMFSIHTGELGAPDIAVAQALADIATIGILQERSIRESSLVAAQLQHALNSRILIEQAKGVVSESGGMTMDEAFATMRKYSRDNNLSLTKVATAVIERRLDPGRLAAASVTQQPPFRRD
ncbi:MAG: GAF and ANTAR domain-containing protein [Kineosporiaceae bacterium]|nr:GAF and ANTAR domain-containing protein [Aeromicrobium sp.]